MGTVAVNLSVASSARVRGPVCRARKRANSLPLRTQSASLVAFEIDRDRLGSQGLSVVRQSSAHFHLMDVPAA